MSMKAAHSVDTKGITGPTRSHIISRLHKASSIVDDLIVALNDKADSNASETDILEARAYSASLVGAEAFEKQSWQACVQSYSESWVLYNALARTIKSDAAKELLSGTIEQSIRYAAYQLRMPRTVAVSAIARKYFPRSDSQLVAAVERLDPTILRDATKAKTGVAETEAASRKISWRSRTADIEDASIIAALTAVDSAATKLAESLSSATSVHAKDRAAAYDELLIASQDAVDATKDAIAELATEGVAQGDKRMQSLQITRTAVSYDLISWRIGRNRVLTGDADGASTESAPVARPRSSKRAKTVKETLGDKEEGAGRKLARLREKVVMYDSTLQSLDSIKELPGAANDSGFLQEVEAKHQYFRALKLLAIARSHSVLSNHKNALALVVRASGLLKDALGPLSSAVNLSKDSPPNISISSEQAKYLLDLLAAETQRLRALVELSDIVSKSESGGSDLPLVARLSTYPTDGVDLKNLVSYPPKLQPIPVKPLFFDVAWNYIGYPGHSAHAEHESVLKTNTPAENAEAPKKPQKKGWFGFGGT